MRAMIAALRCMMLVAMAVAASGCGMMRGEAPTDPPPPPVPSGNTRVDLIIMEPGGDMGDMAVTRVSPGNWATFYVLARNVGNRDGSVRIREQSLSGHWLTKYYDSTGKEITADVRGGGWYSPSIYPTHYVVVRLLMKNDEGKPNRTGNVEVRGYADNTDQVHGQVRTSATNLTEPALQVSVAGGTWTKAMEPRIRTGETLTLYVKAQNEGAKTGNIKISVRGQTEKWRIQAFDSVTGGNDITALFAADGWPQSYAAGATRTIRVEITPNGAGVNDILRLEIVGSGDKSDSVMVQAALLGGYQPDLLLGMEGQEFMGDGVYESDGATQALLVKSPSSVEYWIRIQNDGGLSDQFLVRAAESGESATTWTRRYFDAQPGGNEITAAVLGAGWTTEALAPGASKTIRVLVVPGGSTPALEGGQITIQVTATSAAQPAKADAVKMLTQKAASGAGIRSGVQIEKWRESRANQ